MDLDGAGKAATEFGVTESCFWLEIPLYLALYFASPSLVFFCDGISLAMLGCPTAIVDWR